MRKEDHTRIVREIRRNHAAEIDQLKIDHSKELERVRAFAAGELADCEKLVDRYADDLTRTDARMWRLYRALEAAGVEVTRDLWDGPEEDAATAETTDKTDPPPPAPPAPLEETRDASSNNQTARATAPEAPASAGPDPTRQGPPPPAARAPRSNHSRALSAHWRDLANKRTCPACKKRSALCYHISDPRVRVCRCCGAAFTALATRGWDLLSETPIPAAELARINRAPERIGGDALIAEAPGSW